MWIVQIMSKEVIANLILYDVRYINNKQPRPRQVLLSIFKQGQLRFGQIRQIRRKRVRSVLPKRKAKTITIMFKLMLNIDRNQ